MSRPRLLAVSHGTSDPDGARDIAALVDAVAAALPDVDVVPAFVDVQQPDAAELAPTLDGPLVIVPLLLSRGFHVHHDLHGIADARPDTVVADALGPDPLLAEVLATRLADAAETTVHGGPVVLVVAGSRDPRSVEDADGMADAIAERTGAAPALAYLAAREPDLPTALAQHPDAVAASYLLARGYFFDLAVRQAAGRAITPPLLDGGPVPQPLIDLVVRRYEEAAARL